MSIGYIVYGAHPCLKTILPEEISLITDRKPILIVGFEKALELYPHITLTDKIIDLEKKIYYSFSETEATEKYKENLTNFISNCFLQLTKPFKVINVVDLGDLYISSDTVYLYDGGTFLTITTDLEVFYLNKEIVSFFNRKRFDICEIIQDIRPETTIISWNCCSFFGAFTKSTNTYQSKDQIKTLYSYYGDIDLYMGVLMRDRILSLTPSKKTLSIWQQAYEVETMLSQTKVKVNTELVKTLASDEENIVMQNVYKNINNNYVVQKYNGTDKVTGRIYPQSSGFSLQTLSPSLRKIIVAEKDCVLVEFDYQYFEYALMSQLCNVEIKGDPHLYLSKLLFGDENHRDIGKKINYSLLYGRSFSDIVNEITSTYKLQISKEVLESKLKEITTPISILNQHLTEQWNNTGVLINYMGRNIKPEKGYACLNNYIQSTAADIVITKLKKLFVYLKKYNEVNKVVLQNHDSILLNLKLRDVEETDIASDIKSILEEEENGLVAKVSVKYGENWGELT